MQPISIPKHVETLQYATGKLSPTQQRPQEELIALCHYVQYIYK